MSLHDLPALARDLWWTTQPEAHALWPALDPLLWEACNKSPVALLRTVDLDELEPGVAAQAEALVDRWPRRTSFSTTAMP